MGDKMTLAELSVGQSATVLSIDGGDEMIFRLAELGLIAGQRVTLLKTAPFGDPIEIRLMNYDLCLRKKAASSISIEIEKESSAVSGR